MKRARAGRSRRGGRSIFFDPLGPGGDCLLRVNGGPLLRGGPFVTSLDPVFSSLCGMTFPLRNVGPVGMLLRVRGDLLLASESPGETA